MLNKIIFTAIIFALSAPVGFAQATTDEYQKNEFFVGYSHQRGDHTSSNGFEVSAVRNFSRYFGVKGDFSAAFRHRKFAGNVNSGGTVTQATFRSDNQIYNFLGGVQVKDNATESRFKPFAHALAGVGYGRFKSNFVNCLNTSPSNVVCNSNPVRNSSVGFAGAFGGGLDIKVNDKIDVRAIQVDYNPIYFGNGFRNQARFGIGIVFK